MPDTYHRLIICPTTPTVEGTSSAALNILMYQGKLLVTVFPDEAHDVWNDVQNALKHCPWYGWGVVCMLSLVQNC